jgi:hypothetical protein
MKFINGGKKEKVPYLPLSKKEVKELKDKGKVTKYFTATGFNHNVSHDIVKRYDGAAEIEYKDWNTGKRVKAKCKVEYDKGAGDLLVHVTEGKIYEFGEYIIKSGSGKYLKSFEYGGVSSEWTEEVEEAKTFNSNETAYNVMGYHLSREIVKHATIEVLREGKDPGDIDNHLYGKFKVVQKFVYRDGKGKRIAFEKDYEFDAIYDGPKEIKITNTNLDFAKEKEKGKTSTFMADRDWWEMMIKNGKKIK